MFLALVSHLLCAWFAFALPAYATYKALAHGPDPGALRTLAMYWAVLGLFAACEQSLGPLLAWLPFYWELRTMFLLYISLPQTQGSTYVYEAVLHPWCSKNEADIDAAMVSARANAVAFCRARIAALVDLVSSFLNTSVQPHPDQDPLKPAQPVDQLRRLWAAYGPSLLAAFAPKDTTDVHVSSTANPQLQSHSAN